MPNIVDSVPAQSITAMPESRHLSDLCAELAARTPDHIAVVSEARTLTYAELESAAGDAARALADCGIARGSTVGLLCPNRWEWLAVALGAMRVGARVATFNTWAKAWDLAYMLGHSRAEVLVVVDEFRGRRYSETLLEMIPELARSSPRGRLAAWPALHEVVILGEGDALPGARGYADLIRQSKPAPRAKRLPDDDAFVLYTSGSSARPKAVPLRHRATIENGFAIGERMELTPDDRVLLPTPLFWSFGAVNALPATLTHGATLVLQEAFDAVGALDLIEQHRCTAIYTLPSITQSLIAEPAFSVERTSSLRTGLTIGVPQDVRQAAEGLGARNICNIYGSTETYGNCCVTPASAPYDRRVASQGPPLPGQEVTIVQPGTGTAVDVGVVGEILVRGVVAAGYLEQDGSTLDPICDRDGWYRTGDLGHLDPEGWIHFASRETDMIKTSGINVSPAEVEEVLGLHPDVREVAVVGVSDSKAGQIVVALLEPVAGREIDVNDLRNWCRQRIAAFKIPRDFHVVDALARTDTGKISRRLLQEQLQDRGPRGEGGNHSVASSQA